VTAIPGAERHSATVGGLKLSYLTAGDPTAPPMVLLHALGRDGDDWHTVLPQLAGTYRVYAPDLRGHGRSDFAGRYSHELMRDDVFGFLDVVAIDRCVLIGHSLGGTVAALVAEAAPHRLTRLILEDTAPPRPGGPTMPRPTRPTRPLPFDFAVVTAIIEEVNDPDPAWWDRADAIPIPTLVIGGGSESRIPQRLLADLVDRMPDATLVTIPAGHHVHSARPQEFLAAVRDFLSNRG
jgi:pimeloyl-ACP methyl ester carboxylesterase